MIKTPGLRVLFCGTPEFALPSLRALYESHHTLVGVVTVPDKPQGRGRHVSPSPVKVLAASLGIEPWQPEALDAAEFLASVRRAAPDVIIVVAFRILPEALYEIPRLGAVNLHASLLPAYRGAAPIARALMDGRTETGVTTFQIARKVDTGGVLLQKHVAVLASDNAGSLGQKLAEAGADLVLETLQGLASGSLIPKPQDDALATRAPKLTADDRPIRWHEPAQQSHNRVRALAPAPGATVRRNEKMLKVLETEYRNTPVPESPGTIVNLPDARGLAAATGEGVLIVRELQPEGKAVMTAEAYLRGNPVMPNERLE